MTDDNKYSLNDLIIATAEQKPLDFEAAFNDLVVDRIRDSIESKKIEIAQQMYNYEPENTELETEPELEQEQEHEEPETYSEEE